MAVEGCVWPPRWWERENCLELGTCVWCAGEGQSQHRQSGPVMPTESGSGWPAGGSPVRGLSLLSATAPAPGEVLHL
jgi:hypothetical protein